MKVKRIIVSINGTIQNEISVEPSPEQIEKRRQQICEVKKQYVEEFTSSDTPNQ
jgi:hypothetical protein